MRKHPNNRAAPVTQWTESELAIIRRLAPGKVTAAMAERLIPGHTVAAVKKQLTQERRRQGIVREHHVERPAIRMTMLDPADEGVRCDYPEAWAAAAAASNARFLAALGVGG